MIIPVKCFTCGKVLADKYLFYLQNVRAQKIAKNLDENEVIYLTETTTEKTPEGKVLDKLGLKKLCCRRHMLTHVDIL
jgi:DNA-directed RNA polymerase subunit N (RpoN/RPB10)